MALSYVRYIGDGSTHNYSVPFPYIDRAHVTATVDGVPAAFTWLAPNTIQLAVAPGVGTLVQIRRETPRDNSLVDFQDGSLLLESALDLMNQQLLYISQETTDAVDGALYEDTASNSYDFGGHRGTNVGDPIEPTDVASRRFVEQQTSVPGPQGPQGEVGPVGPAGPQGIQGPIGPSGPQGPRGERGPQGEQGIQGPMGPQGPIGLQGPTGPQGPQGPQGSQGPQGPIGPTGPQGPQGDSFVPDVVAVNSLRFDYDDEPQGFSFLATDLGAISFKNSNDTADWSDWIPFGRGPTGPMGPQGPEGPQGPQGQPGEEGPLGPEGPQGPEGPEGPEGPQGPQGLPGEQGPKGMNFRGEWDAGTTYDVDDVVTFQNTSWIATQDGSGTQPPIFPSISNSHWTIVAGNGDDVALKSGTDFTGKVRFAPVTEDSVGISVPYSDGTAVPDETEVGDVWVENNQLRVRVRDGILNTAGTNLNAVWTGKQTFAPSASGQAGVAIPPGTTPSSPVNGDMWTTSTGFFVRVGSVTYNLSHGMIPATGNALSLTGIKRTTGSWEAYQNLTTNSALSPGTLLLTSSSWSPNIIFRNNTTHAFDWQMLQDGMAWRVHGRDVSAELRLDGHNAYMQYGGEWQLAGQADGNLVLYQGATARWSAQGGWVSMRDMKENVEPITEALSKLRQIDGVTYNLISNPDEREAGVFAEDVENVLPEAVGHLSTPDKDYKLVRYERLTALLIEAVKELEDRVASLEAQLEGAT